MISALQNQRISRQYRVQTRVRKPAKGGTSFSLISSLKNIFIACSIGLTLFYLATSSRTFSLLMPQERLSAQGINDDMRPEMRHSSAATAGSSSSLFSVFAQAIANAVSEGRQLDTAEVVAEPAVPASPFSTAAAKAAIEQSLGAGPLLRPEFRRPPRYEVQEGDTLYALAERYNLSVFSLVRMNRVTDPTRLQLGQTLHLAPSLLPTLEGDAPEEIIISADSTLGVAPLKVNFSADSPLQDGTFLWDLGNWRFAFDGNPSNTFQSPGMYTVKLRVYSGEKLVASSNRLNINVIPRKSQVSDRRFITLAGIGDKLDLGDSAGLAALHQKPVLFKESQSSLYVAVKGGYSRLSLNNGKKNHYLYTFVSPFASVHSFEPDFDWYKTQFGTGIQGNCGPATVAMACLWSTGRDTAVASIRSDIGMPFSNGAIGFEHMLGPLKRRSVPFEFRPLEREADIRAVVDRGNIGIILIHTSQIRKTRGDARKNLVGRYYNDSTGHYIVVKGYTLDGRYFIVYDPIPSDWNANSTRYADGVSMIGRNRFYPVSEIMKALRRYELLEIRQAR
jgi:LysM repeat protein